MATITRLSLNRTPTASSKAIRIGIQARRSHTNDLLLGFGLVSSLLYIGMNVFIPLLWDSYSLTSRTVSELSAVGAPTRSVWVGFGLIYALLLISFGWGVLRSAGDNGALRASGVALFALGVTSLYWPPMHMRGTETSLTDTLHIVWTLGTLLLMTIAIGSGALGLGKRFRIYSVVTLVVFLVFGGLTAREAPFLAANLPTPSIGLWERINIAAFMLWIAVLAIALRGKSMALSDAR